MTQVPSERPETADPGGVAGTVRRHLLAAAQASLRAVRELLDHFTSAGTEPHRPATIDAPPPTSAKTPIRIRPEPARDTRVPPAPSADLLRHATALPATYGSDRLVLLARDPHCLYAYWDLSEARASAVRAETGSEQLRLILRTYDVTQIAFDAQPPNRFHDFAVAGDARSLYAYIGKPAACFVAEIGYLRPDGGFFAVARSLPIWTPRTDHPGVAPGRWMTVGWNERRDAAGTVVPLAAPAATTTVLAGEPEATHVASRQAPSSWPETATSGQQRGSWSLVRGGLATATPASDS